jgi:hypothetical protein
MKKMQYARIKVNAFSFYSGKIAIERKKLCLPRQKQIQARDFPILLAQSQTRMV